MKNENLREFFFSSVLSCFSPVFLYSSFVGHDSAERGVNSDNQLPFLFLDFTLVPLKIHKWERLCMWGYMWQEPLLQTQGLWVMAESEESLCEVLNKIMKVHLILKLSTFYLPQTAVYRKTSQREAALGKGVFTLLMMCITPFVATLSPSTMEAPSIVTLCKCKHNGKVSVLGVALPHPAFWAAVTIRVWGPIDSDWLSTSQQHWALTVLPSSSLPTGPSVCSSSQILGREEGHLPNLEQASSMCRGCGNTPGHLSHLFLLKWDICIVLDTGMNLR